MATRLRDAMLRAYTGYRPLARTAETLPPGAVHAIGLRALRPSGEVDLLQLDWAEPRSGGPVDEDRIRMDDVLFAVRGSVLKSALFTREVSEPLYPTANIAVLRTNPDIIDPGFLWAWTQYATEHLPQFRRASTGQLLVSVGELTGLELELPPIEKQKEIGNVAAQMIRVRARHVDVVNATEAVFAAFIRQSFASELK